MNNFEQFQKSKSYPLKPFRIIFLIWLIAFSLLAFTWTGAASGRGTYHLSNLAPTQATASNVIPHLMTQGDSNRALALETITQKVEPFSPVFPLSSGPDNRNRITFFALNLNWLSGDSPSSIVVDAEDGNSQLYQLPVEYVGKLAECNDVTYFIVRLPDQLGDVGDVLVRLNVHGSVSNRVRVGIGHIGGGPPDDPSPGPTPTPAPSPSPPPTPTYVIVGQVMESNGSGLPGVSVNLSDSAGVTLRTALTQADGTFSFDLLPAGTNISVTPQPTALYTFNSKVFTNLNANERLHLYRAAPSIHGFRPRHYRFSRVGQRCDDLQRRRHRVQHLDGFQRQLLLQPTHC